jgi:hypothetical protein
MTAPKSHREDSQTDFPRSNANHPNLATLDRLRGLRRPRLMTPEARRHQVPQECTTC